MPTTQKLLTAAAGSAGGDQLYVEDVFSTFLYEGSNGARTIANGIALSDEGGLVWLKNRALDSHVLFDTVNGSQKSLSSNSTDAGSNYSSYLSFPSAGTAGWNLAGAILNGTGTSWASWSFRKAEKFFDVVTYTGDGTSSRTIAHSLGSVPAFMTVKSSSNISGWRTYHASLGATKYVQLQTNAAAATYNVWNDTTPTDSVFSISTDINANGVTYVAYLFASDAGGFGDDGDENIITCGSYEGNGSTTGPIINLGYEPQWILIKDVDTGTNWTLFDSMRGMPVGGADARLFPNLNNAESDFQVLNVLPTGFQLVTDAGGFNENNKTHIYMAIRRPMKTPESGTEVFGLRNFNETNDYQQLPTGNLVDLGWEYLNSNGALFFTRMIGKGYLNPTTNGAANTSAASAFDFMDGFDPHYANNVSGFSPRMVYGFTRATGFMDVVCYTGTGSFTALPHNLTVPPELFISKARSAIGGWTTIYSTSSLGATSRYVSLDTNAASGNWGNAALTATTFGLSQDTAGVTYVNYLFATLAGVSKVGIFTATGSDLNVDCGFTGGARFILIKRTDSSGDWYTYDSARGISAGNDPYFLLNSTAAEVTNTDYIDPLSAGFTVTSNASSTINVNGGTYLFLAIA